MKKLLFFTALWLIASAAQSQPGSVDTAIIFSPSNQVNIKAVVIKPANYSDEKRFPVVYLLHGYGGAYHNWITKVPALKDYASKYQFIVVCPNGENSWYINSPVKKASNFETYITEELVGYMDKNYKTIADKRNRAITGLSMGGHGGLMLGIRHKDLFGAAGSMSGALDLEPLIAKYDFSQLIGDTAVTHFNWRSYSVLAIADSITTKDLRMIIDCGVKDGFIKDNRKLHEKLLSQNVAHDYIERPGAHNWAYWGNAVEYQLLFFRKFFNEAE